MHNKSKKNIRNWCVWLQMILFEQARKYCAFAQFIQGVRFTTTLSKNMVEPFGTELSLTISCVKGELKFLPWPERPSLPVSPAQWAPATLTFHSL